MMISQPIEKTSIHEFPNELLERSFSLAEDSRNVALPSPLDICIQVCQRWRQVALQRPSLWHDVTIPVGRSWCRDPYAWAKIHLEHSEPVLVDISFVIPDALLESESKEMQEM